MKVCLVTEELAGFQGSGGIGAAFYELAILLAKTPENKVDILYCSVGDISGQFKADMKAFFTEKKINLSFLNVQNFIHGSSLEGRSYAVYQTLKNKKYDTLHFHDYKALGFYCFSAKKQGVAFKHSSLVLQMHGPTAWTTKINQSMYHHEDHLKLDFMERQCARDADFVVSPSQYLIDFLKIKANYIFPANTSVINNLGTALVEELESYIRPYDKNSCDKVNEIIFFARHEDRKGFVKFCNAIDNLKDKIIQKGIRVTFIGKFGQIVGQHSGLYLSNRAKNWSFPLSIYTDMNRDGAASYLTSNRNSLVVIPSEENSPYTVFETLSLHKALVTSSKGGAKEMIPQKYWKHSLADTDVDNDLTDKIESWLDAPKTIPTLSKDHKNIEVDWLLFHENAAKTVHKQIKIEQPLVTVGITHYERPDKIFDALDSILNQTYKNIEIIVVDDGSKKESTIEVLNFIKKMFKGTNHRLVVQKNAYLGAARNTVGKLAKGEYLCFLDDDDIAFPKLIESLVCSIQYAECDIVNCLNLFMDLKDRDSAINQLEHYEQKASYVPLGGPLSLSYQENLLGAATALIRKSFYDKIGGYTEDKGVGYEDYEFFFRALQCDGNIRILPEPLYLYEVGRPSMISNTSTFRNFNRVISKIDPSLHPEACMDFIQLTVGKKAHIQQTNSVDYSTSQAGFSDISLPIQRGHIHQHDEIRHQLVKYSMKLGAFSAAKAFGESLAPKTNKVPKLDLKKSMHFRTLQNQRKYKELFRELIIFSSIREDNFLSVLKLFKKILANNECTKELILDDFELLYSNLSGYYEALPLIISTAKAAGLEAEYENNLAELKLRSETEYLTRYPDVAEAVKKELLKSGLEHYNIHGKNEGRIGFTNI